MIETRAFITGSHAYGVPRPDSDVDLVVLVSKADMDKLTGLADDNDEIEIKYPDACCAVLRFGKLNLLATDSIAYYQTWIEGTWELKCRPLGATRDEAIQVFQAKRAALKAKIDADEAAREQETTAVLVSLEIDHEAAF